jgi:putative toxin-antitoxin system antitoxin component (TIGR02293 family)
MANELVAIVKELGGEKTFGRPVHTEQDMNREILAGFPHSAVEHFRIVASLSWAELAASLGLSVRSLQRRKHQGRLEGYESDRIYRLARIVALSADYLGSSERGIDWLKQPNIVLGGIRPLDAVETELGARQVENVLGRIGYGGLS